MTDVPRRVRPTPESRLKTTVNAQRGLSEGRSRALRPVQPRAGGAGRSQQGIDAASLPRVALVTGWGSADYPSMTQPTGRYFLNSLPSGPDWGVDEDAGGGVISFPDDDGGIYIFQPGIYAVTLITNIGGIQDADPDCSIRLGADVSSPFASGFSCVTRGGDAHVTHADLTSTCRVYFDEGRGLSGGIFPWFMYTNLDMGVVDNVAGLIQVQQIVAG